MPQARGAQGRLLFQKEVAFRTAPAAAAKVLPYTSWDVKRAANRAPNNTINQSALMNKTDAGDPTVGGAFESILDLRTIGNWLLLLFGAPTTGRAVTVQPVNVTGVTVHYASADCTAGVGTLSYTAIGTTMTWTPQGGAAGAAVNVGAGGNFTLLGGGGGKSVRITVVAASLPVGDANDATIDVSATLKAHAFPVNTAERPSGLFEYQQPDNGKYYRQLGDKLGQLRWDPLANEQNIAGQIIGAVETEEVAAFDAAPTIVAPVRACAGKGSVSDGAAGLGKIVGADIEVNNNMNGGPCADGLEGYGYIDHGELAIGGNIRTVFDSAGAYALARAGTSTRFRIESAAPSGADTFRLVLDALYAELTENAPAKQGRSGLVADTAWKLHAGTYDPEFYLVNDVAGY